MSTPLHAEVGQTFGEMRHMHTISTFYLNVFYLN